MIALATRSFCELVIVGQLDRWPSDPIQTARARDGTYGLFSIFFLACMIKAIPSNSGDDPLVQRQTQAVDEVKSWVAIKLDSETENGRKTSPSLEILLEQLKTSLATKQRNDPEFVLWNMKIMEINRLEKLFADWMPISKWSGNEEQET
jgi:hypothetical protein